MNEGMEKAQKFVRFFYTHIKDGATQHVTTMYELTFPRITADFFPDKPWPHPDALKHLVDDYVFWMLYTVRVSPLWMRAPMSPGVPCTLRKASSAQARVRTASSC